jgi:hypothetical protein
VAQQPPWPIKRPSPAALKQISASLEGETPHGKPPARSRAQRPLERVSASFEGSGPLSESSPRSRVPVPRANLCLVRGFRPLERISTSLEASGPSSESPPRSRVPAPSSGSPPRSRLPLDPLHLTCSPDRSIKCSDMPRAPGSKGNSPPRRSSDTAWESVGAEFGPDTNQ